MENKPTGTLTALLTDSLAPGPKNSGKTPNIEAIRAKLRNSQETLTRNSSGEIQYSRPLITLGGETGIIRPGTINLIQGKMGSHKSRFAAYLAALCLSRPTNDVDFLGFTRPFNGEKLAVLYIDTERNKRDEFPRDIQYIRELAGYERGYQMPEFLYFSLKDQERSERLIALQECINMARETFADMHLVIFLDVVTDCIKSYNDEGESLALWDFLGNLCENNNVTIIAVIHENPGSSDNPKARGHAGTEGGNKSSCVMQIAYERDRSGVKDTDVLRIAFLKIRAAARPEPLYIRFEEGRFVPEDNSTVAQIAAASRARGDIDLVTMWVGTRLGNGEPEERKTFLRGYMDKFDCTEKTAETRLDDVIRDQVHIYDAAGKQCYLIKENAPKGNKRLYRLERVHSEETPAPTLFPALSEQDEAAQIAAAPKDGTTPF